MSQSGSKTSYSSQPRKALAGSERDAFPAESAPRLPFATPAEPSEPVTVSVLVKRKTAVDPTARLSHEEFERRCGADPDAVAEVRAFAAEFGLTVDSVHEARRTVQLSGSAEAMQQAFGVRLEHRATAAGTLRLRSGAILLPESLEGAVEAVLGLDNRPQAKPHFRTVAPRAASASYSPAAVGKLYGFPTTGAAGQTIGLIELGGGYKPADITTYFSGLGLKAPTVTAVSVDKAKNTPSGANGADGEVLLDIEVAAAVAQGAAIAVYFAPNTDQGFLDAITTAVHDTTRKPSVISISWGGPESSWTAQAMTAMDEACQAAASLGVTITVAAGDDGSSDGTSANAVDFPASSPHVLACGGTKLVGSGSTITSEVVWNETASNEGATGGGVSQVFALPSWQAKSNVPASASKGGGRGVPDVAGNADPTTGYQVRVDGENTVIGGTSAVAPLWAGLIAVANAAHGSNAGFINPALYAATEGSTFRDITSGNNGAFAAGKGWDACTGLGSPAGAAVVAVLKAAGATAKH